MSENSHALTVLEEDLAEFKRLDHFLMHKLPHLSRSEIKRCFEEKKIEFTFLEKTTNPNSLSKMPSIGTLVTLTLGPPKSTDVLAEDIPLTILYEDEHLLFIDKAAGMVVHPAPGNWSKTLVNALLFHCKDLEGIGGVERPGIVHRLDQGTSGVMVVAKTQKAHQGLTEMFAAHNLKREYIALAMPFSKQECAAAGEIKTLYDRHPKNRLKMTSRINKGKEAITYYKVLHKHPEVPLTLMKLTLQTGKTHQIRVHLSEQINMPLFLDDLYANVPQQKERLKHWPDLLNLVQNYSYPMLHAHLLALEHPITKEKLSFKTIPPAPFSLLLKDYFPGFK
mgnify:CR=1 FL=1